VSRKVLNMRDTTLSQMMSQSTVDKMVARIYGLGRGSVFTPKDFLDIGNHATVRQALARFERDGFVRRLMRGVYEYPAFSDLLRAPASPDPDAIARAIARNHGWTILPSGDTALNLLGLSRQVTAQWQYLSDGPSRVYQWSAGTIIFKHRTQRETSALSAKTAILVQAIKTLGENRMDEATIAVLTAKFDARERVRALREAKHVTAWVYEVIKRLNPDGREDA
jgi:hypothetical protein